MNMTTTFKELFLQNRLANQNQILCEASLGKGIESIYIINGPGHGTTPIYGKNRQKTFSYRTKSPMIMKLGMEH